jgi:hypothetical protein
MAWWGGGGGGRAIERVDILREDKHTKLNIFGLDVH